MRKGAAIEANRLESRILGGAQKSSDRGGGSSTIETKALRNGDRWGTWMVRRGKTRIATPGGGQLI